MIDDAFQIAVDRISELEAECAAWVEALDDVTNRLAVSESQLETEKDKRFRDQMFIGELRMQLNPELAKPSLEDEMPYQVWVCPKFDHFTEGASWYNGTLTTLPVPEYTEYIQASEPKALRIAVIRFLYIDQDQDKLLEAIAIGEHGPEDILPGDNQ